MFHFVHLPLTEWRAPVSFLLRFESLLMIRPSVNTVAQIGLRLFLVPLEPPALPFFSFSRLSTRASCPDTERGHAEVYRHLEGL